MTLKETFSSAKDSARVGSSGVYTQPYGVGIGDDITDYLRQMHSIMNIVDGASVDDETTFSKDNESVVDIVANDTDASPTLNKKGVGDSSIFGNDVINPYAGFCRDDDIVPVYYSNGKASTTGSVVYGMGRVYQEIYDSKQQVLYMQFGIPKYRNLRSFLMNAVDSDMENINENPKSSLAGTLGRLVRDGVQLMVELPFMPLEFMWHSFNQLPRLSATQITEFFYFREEMMLYWRYVNTILAHVAVGMGLFELTGTMEGGIPEILKGGPDIFAILSARSRRFGVNVAIANKSTDDLLGMTLNNVDPTVDKDGNDKGGDEEKGFLASVADWFSDFWTNVWNGVTTSVLDSNKFLALRIEKGSDNAAESFTNNTQPSQLSQKLNNEVAQTRQRNFDEIAQSTDWLSGIANTFRKLSSLKDKVINLVHDPTSGVPGIINYMAAGNGYFDLPSQWAGSSYSRSVSVNIRLRSKTGGDPISIYTNIMIPLACIMAAAMPRQTGDGTYTSPFICRAWCRGMFSVPAGIIQSLSISRGDGEFGWSLMRLPTTVSISMSIADLSPIMFLGLAGQGPFERAFNNNTKLIDYLNTLTGVGIKQRYYMSKQLIRNGRAFLKMLGNQTLSGAYFGMKLGDSFIGRAVSTFMKVSRMRINDN